MAGSGLGGFPLALLRRFLRFLIFGDRFGRAENHVSMLERAIGIHVGMVGSEVDPETLLEVDANASDAPGPIEEHGNDEDPRGKPSGFGVRRACGGLLPAAGHSSALFINADIDAAYLTLTFSIDRGAKQSTVVIAPAFIPYGRECRQDRSNDVRA